MTCAVILQEELEGAASVTPRTAEEGAQYENTDRDSPDAELFSSLPSSPIFLKRSRKELPEAKPQKKTTPAVMKTEVAKGRKMSGKQKKVPAQNFPAEQSTRVELPDTTNSLWCIDPSLNVSCVTLKQQDVRLARSQKGPSQFPAVGTEKEESVLCSRGLLNIICKRASYHNHANLEKGATSGIMIACGPTVQFD